MLHAEQVLTRLRLLPHVHILFVTELCEAQSKRICRVHSQPAEVTIASRASDDEEVFGSCEGRDLSRAEQECLLVLDARHQPCPVLIVDRRLEGVDSDRSRRANGCEHPVVALPSVVVKCDLVQRLTRELKLIVKRLL